MSIRRQSKSSWEVRLYAHNPVTGKAERRSFTVKGSYQDARKAEAKLKLEALEGKLAMPSKETVAEYADYWLDTTRATVRPNSAAGYKKVIRNWIKPYIGQMELNRVSGETVNHLYASLLRDGKSHRTVRHTHNLLNRMLKDAVRWGRLASNPVDRADPPRSQRKELQAWNERQVKQWLAYWEGDALYYALYRLAAMTGMRRSELLGLRWQDVDLDNALVKIRQVRVEVEGEGEIVAEPKTRSSVRDVPIDAKTAKALAEWKDYLQEERYKAYPSWLIEDSELVFVHPDGSLPSPNAISKHFTYHAKQLGLNSISFHGLRHTNATLLIEAGVPTKVVSQRLGHANVSITLGTYTHPSEQALSQAVETLSGIVD